MSTANQASGGGEQSSGGASENQTNNQTNSSSDGGQRAPSYESHQKALDEKKAAQKKYEDAQKKLDEYERKEKERTDAELKKQGEYQKLLEQREADLKAEKDKAAKLQSSIDDSRKMSAFLDKVSGDVPRQYWALIDLEKIAVDPQTGMPDEASITKAVKEFEKQFPDVIKKGSSATLPNDAAQGGGGKLSYEAWLKLPLKEQKARMKDVDKSTL